MYALLRNGFALGTILVIQPAFGQTVDHIDVFRDAVVVTWKADVSPGACKVARSFHASSAGDVAVFGGREASRGTVRRTEMEWFGAGKEEQWNETRAELEGRRIDQALKVAQLELVEEDLALLRANRKVGGTAESLLVEDLEEMADWMHEALRDLLFRRVELKAEIEKGKAELVALEQAAQDLAPRKGFTWWVDMPSGASGTMTTQVVERGEGLQWSPRDVLALGSGDDPALRWMQRAEVMLDLPRTGGAVPVRFHDAMHAGLDARPDAVPVLLDITYGATKAAYDAAPRSDRSSDWPGVQWSVEDGLAPGVSWSRSVSLGSLDLPVKVLHFSVPKQAPAVNMRLALAMPSSPVARMEQALLTIDERPVGRVWLTERDDSLFVDAGVVRDWSVERERLAALCSKSTLGGRVKHHRAYRITVRNRSRTAGTIRLEEPLPASAKAEVAVVPEELDGGRLDEGTSIIHWELELGPGESRTVQFAFDVSHGKDDPVPAFD